MREEEGGGKKETFFLLELVFEVIWSLWMLWFCVITESSNNIRSKCTIFIFLVLTQTAWLQIPVSIPNLHFLIVTCKYSFILCVSFPLWLECFCGSQKVAFFMFSFKGMCFDSFNISCFSHSLTPLPVMGCSNPSPPLPSLRPLIPHPHVVPCARTSVGVCSAWAVGGVVIMESVLCDLWAGHQDAYQEVCERRRSRGLQAARDSDQTLQHSSLSWLVPSPFTSHTQSLSAYSSMSSPFSSKSQNLF